MSGSGESSILSWKGHANLLQTGQLNLNYFSTLPPVSNLLLALTLMVSDLFVEGITLSMYEVLILNNPSGQMCPWGQSKVRPKAVFDVQLAIC